MKLVDLGEPRSFLDHMYLNTEKCSSHELLLGQLKKLPGREKPHAKTVAWSYDMDGHAKKCVERYCELAKTKKKTEQLYEVSTPCLDDHHLKKEEPESVVKSMLSDCLNKILVFGTNW